MQSTGSERVLKAGTIRNMGSKVAFNYQDIERQGEAYLAKINEEAQQILNKAKAEAQAITEAATGEGRNEGFAEGLKNAQQEIEAKAKSVAEAAVHDRVQAVVPALEKVGNRVQEEREVWLSSWESIAIQLAAKIAEKLVRYQIDLNPELPRELLKSTLELVAGTPQINVSLSPADYEALGTEQEQVIKALSGCGTVQVLADDQLKKGDSRVETQYGTIDAQIDTQIERIANELSANT